MFCGLDLVYDKTELPVEGDWCHFVFEEAAKCTILLQKPPPCADIVWQITREQRGAKGRERDVMSQDAGAGEKSAATSAHSRLSRTNGT